MYGETMKFINLVYFRRRLSSVK